MHPSAHAAGICEAHVCPAGTGRRRQCDVVCRRLSTGSQSSGPYGPRPCSTSPSPTCVPEDL